MKIKKVEIKGLFGKKDIEWELNPQVNVLVGENGSGKSTILSILYQLLLKEDIKNQKLKLLENIIITDYNNETVSFKLSSLNDLNNAFELFLSEMLKKNSSMTLDMLLHEMESSFEKETNFDKEAGYFVKYSKNIHKFLDNLYLDIIEANLTNSNANHIIQKSNQETTNALDMEIRETIHELNKIQSQKVIDRLVLSLNTFFNQIGKNVTYQDYTLFYTDSQLNKQLNYSNLSSGERQLIYILLRVALSNKDKNKTAIILMDEPEISLHVNWQADFIKQLTLLNPDAQFIIVTHSPAIIMNGWNDVYVNMEEITK